MAGVSQSVGVDMQAIEDHFQSHVWPNSAPDPCIQNLIGNRWVSEKEIDAVFGILNSKHPNILSMVYKPDEYVADTLKTKMKKKIVSSECKSLVLLALNVGRGAEALMAGEKEITGLYLLLILTRKLHFTVLGGSRKFNALCQELA